MVTWIPRWSLRAQYTVSNVWTSLVLALDRLNHTDPHLRSDEMLVSLTVEKVDAGVAVLLTEDKRLVCVYLFP